jgi:hypothetical protein
VAVLGAGVARVRNSYLHGLARAVAVNEDADVEVSCCAFEELSDGVFIAGDDAQRVRLRFTGNAAMANPWVGEGRPGHVHGTDNEFYVPEKYLPLE